jgi:hypothetical protein
MPEQDGLIVTLAPRLHSGNDLAHLGMKRRLGKPSRPHVLIWGNDAGKGAIEASKNLVASLQGKPLEPTKS